MLGIVVSERSLDWSRDMKDIFSKALRPRDITSGGIGVESETEFDGIRKT